MSTTRGDGWIGPIVVILIVVACFIVQPVLAIVLLIKLCIGLLLLSPIERLPMVYRVPLAFLLSSMPHVILFFIDYLGSPVPLGVVLALECGLPVLIGVFFYKNLGIQCREFTKLRISLQDSLSLSAVLIISLAFLHPLFSGDVVSTLDTYRELWMGQDVASNILGYGDIFSWTSGVAGGYARFTFEGFLTYFDIGIMRLLLPKVPLVLIGNSLTILNLLILVSTAYLFCRTLGFSAIESAFSTALLWTGAPFFKLVAYGNFRPVMATASIPLMLIFFYRSIKERWYLFPIAILITLRSFHHPLYALTALLIMLGCTSIMRFRDQIDNKFLGYIVLFVILEVVVTAVRWIPFSVFLQYTTPSNFGMVNSNLPLYLLKLFLISTSPFGYVSLFSIAVIGGCLVVVFRLTQGKFNPFLAGLSLSIVLVYGACALTYLLGLRSILDVVWQRPVMLAVFPLSGFLLRIRKKWLRWVLVGSAFLLLVGSTVVALQEFRHTWIVESVHKQFPDRVEYKNKGGRFVQYGIPRPSHLFETAYGISTVDQVLHQGQSLDIIDKVRYDESLGLLPQNRSMIYVHNLYEVFGIDHVLFFYCHEKSAKEVLKIEGRFERYKDSSLGVIWKPVFRDECFFLIRNMAASDAEVVTPVRTSLGMDYFDLSGAANGIPLNTAAVVVNSQEEIERIPPLRRLNIERFSDESLIIKGEIFAGDWVSVNEAYFPRWHAYQEGIEIPVYQSDMKTVLIRSEGSGKIELVYRHFVWEKALAALSFFVVVGLCFAWHRFS